jgi:hypothetical protein
MITDAKRIPGILKSNGLPDAPEAPIDARWIASSGDWWVRTKKSWYWFDNRGAGAWKLAPNGPPGG